MSKVYIVSGDSPENAKEAASKINENQVTYIMLDSSEEKAKGFSKEHLPPGAVVYAIDGVGEGIKSGSYLKTINKLAELTANLLKEAKNVIIIGGEILGKNAIADFEKALFEQLKDKDIEVKTVDGKTEAKEEKSLLDSVKELNGGTFEPTLFASASDIKEYFGGDNVKLAYEPTPITGYTEFNRKMENAGMITINESADPAVVSRLLTQENTRQVFDITGYGLNGDAESFSISNTNFKDLSLNTSQNTEPGANNDVQYAKFSSNVFRAKSFDKVQKEGTTNGINQIKRDKTIPETVLCNLKIEHNGKWMYANDVLLDINRKKEQEQSYTVYVNSTSKSQTFKTKAEADKYCEDCLKKFYKNLEKQQNKDKGNDKNGKNRDKQPEKKMEIVCVGNHSGVDYYRADKNGAVKNDREQINLDKLLEKCYITIDGKAPNDVFEDKPRSQSLEECIKSVAKGDNLEALANGKSINICDAATNEPIAHCSLTDDNKLFVEFGPDKAYAYDLPDRAIKEIERMQEAIKHPEDHMRGADLNNIKFSDDQSR